MVHGDPYLSENQSSSVAARVREEIARRRISRQRLADDARISLSTLEKALSGHRPFTLATIIRLEQAMGVALREPGGALAPKTGDTAERAVANGYGSGHAPEELGAYSRPAVSWLEGTYLTLRPSFGDPDVIFAYCTEIVWDDEGTRLRFRERERTDASFSQHGSISVPHLSGHIYLVTNTSGQYRMVVLSRPSITGEMFGLLTTLRAGQGAQLTPVSTPLVLLPLSTFTEPTFGRVARGDDHYSAYAAILGKVLADNYAAFVSQS
jgi:transcriptional regulator with XRE-family HTH domain